MFAKDVCLTNGGKTSLADSNDGKLLFCCDFITIHLTCVCVGVKAEVRLSCLFMRQQRKVQSLQSRNFWLPSLFSDSLPLSLQLQGPDLG